MLHADHSSPTKVRRSGAMKMRREVYPREPQVSVVTRTIYASSTSTSTGMAMPVEDTPIPFGPIVGGIAGGVLIVLLAVGGWWWWVSKMRAAKAMGAKTRRAQDLAAARTGHGKTESTETLNTKASHSKSQSSYMSEKSATSPTHEPVQKPSAILAAQQKNPRSPVTHQTTSSTSLASSKYAPLRPSPLALNVVNRASSAMSEEPPTVVVTAPPQTDSNILSPQTAALRSISPLPPKVNVVPPSPPPPKRSLDAPGTERNQRESVQSMQSVLTVASEYSLDSPVGVAYGGDEMTHEAYANPMDDWRASKPDVADRR